MKYSAVILLLAVLILGRVLYSLVAYASQEAKVPSANGEYPEGSVNIQAEKLSDTSEIEKGVQLMQTYCNVCHNVKTRTHDELLAPPLWGARMQYLRKYPKPDEFTDQMIEYVSEPKHETSLMPQAVERFGLMPMLPLPDELLRPIVTAIYAGHVDRPSWARGNR